MNSYQDFLSYSARVFAKTSEALPACAGNQYMREKVASSIDRDKVAAMECLVKTASATANILRGAQYGLGGGLGILAPAVAGAYIFGPGVASAAGNAARKEVEDTAKDWAGYLAPIAAVVGLGGGAKAGLFGEKAKETSNSITDAISGLFSSKKEASVQDPTALNSITYKIAAAKTLLNLTAAKESCSDPQDLEKISAAHDECAQILFDCIFYL